MKVVWEEKVVHSSFFYLYKNLGALKGDFGEIRWKPEVTYPMSSTICVVCMYYFCHFCLGCYAQTCLLIVGIRWHCLPSIMYSEVIRLLGASLEGQTRGFAKWEHLPIVIHLLGVHDPSTRKASALFCHFCLCTTREIQRGGDRLLSQRS